MRKIQLREECGYQSRIIPFQGECTPFVNFHDDLLAVTLFGFRLESSSRSRFMLRFRLRLGLRFRLRFGFCKEFRKRMIKNRGHSLICDLSVWVLFIPAQFSRQSDTFVKTPHHETITPTEYNKIIISHDPRPNEDRRITWFSVVVGTFGKPAIWIP